MSFVESMTRYYSEKVDRDLEWLFEQGVSAGEKLVDIKEEQLNEIFEKGDFYGYIFLKGVVKGMRSNQSTLEI